MKMKIEDFRKKIDELDVQIVELLNQRSEEALQVGKIKQLNKSGIFVPERENEVLKNVMKFNHGPLKEENLLAIYREIMSAAKALEGKLRVAYLGPPATHSHQAALNRFGQSVEYLPQESFEEVFLSVEKGMATYGMLPVENSREGAVTSVQDLLTKTPLKIYAESYLRIDNFLLSNAELNEICLVYSHPQPLAQCRHWLRDKLPRVECTPVSSTAIAAQRAAENQQTAAIGSRLAAELYHLPLRAECIQDQADNTTRFLVLGKKYGPPSGDDKTSLFFGLQHKVGALNAILSILEDHGLNMLRIESRPSPFKQWEYHFFVDLEGHADNPEFASTLNLLKEHCIFLTVLGSYPKATTG